MYPYVRIAKEIVKARSAPPLPVGATHVSHHRCWPHDIDPWLELNNGRTLTLFDLGRIPLAMRSGFFPALRANRWGFTVAGVAMRYRRRIPTWARFEMRSRGLGFDDKFVYIDQSSWLAGECANQAIYRMAVVGKSGIVPPEKLMAAAGRSTISPALPDWVQAWIAAEDARLWPPERRD